MSKDFARDFYDSAAWKNCREAYKKKVCYLCERCGAPGVIVHHKIRVTPETIEDPSVLLNFDNLKLLCMRCHNREHADEMKPKREGNEWKRYTIDENGKVIVKW